MAVKRATNKHEDVISKVERLKSKMMKDPYHQYKGSNSQKLLRAGYQWIAIVNDLENINKEEIFSKIMESDLFAKVEKDFILFNMHRLKEISKWPYWKFNLEVGQFLLESSGVEFDEGAE